MHNFEQNWYREASEKLECKFARYEGAEQERSIWYHGTSSGNIPSILSQGLLANPKSRAWKDDTTANFSLPSMASISGVYVTTNVQEARSASITSLKYHKYSQRAIVIMELQPRTLLMDEDDITQYIKSALVKPDVVSTGSEGMTAITFMSKALKNRMQSVYESRRNYKVLIADLLEKQYGKFHPELRERIESILDEGWEIALNRQAAYISPYEWKIAFYSSLPKSMEEAMLKKNLEIENSKSSGQKTLAAEQYDQYVNSIVPKQPNQLEMEKEFRNFTDQLTRTLKMYARPLKRSKSTTSMDIARSIDNIGFTGSNKIIGIVQIDEDNNVSLVYGYMPEDFKIEWRKYYNKLTMKNNQKAASIDNQLYKTAYKEIWYHGTFMSNYSKIAAEGLLANPPQRLWDDKGGDIIVPSQASLSGIYLTKDIAEAIGAPDNAFDSMAGVSKESKERIIENDFVRIPPYNSILLAIVQADTKSLNLDEDAVSFKLSQAIENTSDYMVCSTYICWMLKMDTHFVDAMKDRFIKTNIDKLSKMIKTKHNEAYKRIYELLDKGFVNVLTRQVSYAEPKEWQKAFVELTAREERKLHKKIDVLMPQQPSSTKGEQLYREFVDQLTKTLKFSTYNQDKAGKISDGEWTSGRYPSNISFSGSTKLMALVEVFIRDSRKEESNFLMPNQYKYKIIYGKPPEKFFSDWELLIHMSLDPVSQKQMNAEKEYDEWFEKHIQGLVK